VVAAYKRRAKIKFRNKKRNEGYAWLCAISAHDSCNGWVGRLHKDDDPPREPCKCECHKEPW